jgi:uncharacterized protein YjbJ (UPF0337 family)
MNEDILKGQWSQLKGKARVRWGKLTDNDLAQIKGDGEVLKGKLQEYYGRSREQAEKDVQDWLEAERASLRGQNV